MARFPQPQWRSALGTICIALLASACSLTSGDKSAAEAASDEPQPQDAEKAVLDAFDSYQVVGGFSASHGNKEVDDFLLDLIRNPAFPDKVTDIAVECGNALYQDVLDRYIAGEDVPTAEVRKVWRDTGSPNCGFSTFYEQLFPLVRRINEDLPADRRLRVLACDPPLDWTKITNLQQFEQATDRESSIARVIETEVLAKDRKALLLFGINHVRHSPGSAVDQYEAKGYDGVTYVIDDHHGFGNNDPELGKENDELEARMAEWPTPSIMAVEGSWLEDLDAGYFGQPAGEEPTDDAKGPPGVDAYLYVGPRDLLLREPLSAQAMLDDDYLAELARRAAIKETPPDSPSHPVVVLERESEAGVFSDDPDSAGSTP